MINPPRDEACRLTGFTRDPTVMRAPLSMLRCLLRLILEAVAGSVDKGSWSLSFKLDLENG